MKYLCPNCGQTLVTEDEFIFTCPNCDETFTIDELREEYGLETTGEGCPISK